MVAKTAIQLAASVTKEVITHHVAPVVSDSSLRLPPLPSPKELLRIYKIRAQRHLSQNFLLDHRLTNKIVTKTGNVRNCYVCEVGPGPGNISQNIILNGAKHLVVIEKDRRFLPALELLADASEDRMTIINSDVMDFDMEKVFPKDLAHDWTVEPPPFYIIGNLPFNISTPLIIRWLRHAASRTGPFAHGRTRLSLTFQKEVAQRMVAESRSAMRCRLSIMCQYLCDVKLLFTIPGRAFFPKPEVDVSLVKLTPLIKPIIKQPFSLVEKVTRTLFHCRKKHCHKQIRLLFPDDRPEFTELMLEKTKIYPKKRAIDLEIEEFGALCDVYSDLCEQNEGLINYDFRCPSTRKIAKTAESHEVYENYF